MVLALTALAALGCATAKPVPPPRAATMGEKTSMAPALAPLLRAANLWSGPADGCAVALGILPTDTVNLAVGPHATCKFALLVTEGALQKLTVRELQAALAHELGHVQLGHFAARQSRRQAEKRTDEAIDSAGAVGGAAGAIPVIGPFVAVGTMAAQMVAHFGTKGVYRAYDREEEAAADRFAVTLLERLTPGGCRALAELFDRMQKERSVTWASWLSTHPSLGRRLDDTISGCPER
jgi:Zn-dependent protease with chaperone function